MIKRKKTDERRKQIAAAAGALFAERGVRDTTVRDIGDRVGLLSGSLYHHFKTKTDIVHGIMGGYGEDLVARYERAALPGGTSIEKLRRLFHACFEANLEHPDEEAILIRELDNLFREPEFSYVHETLSKIEEIFVNVIEEGIRRREIRANIDPRFVYRMMMDVMGTVPRWYDPRTHHEAEIVDHWIETFFQGIGAPIDV
ncbi:MAG: TetR/AcrR family transcriptional regulator [bacterium]|nr:TetR/AcrR family transcriptional regulator [bacterium]